VVLGLTLMRRLVVAGTEPAPAITAGAAARLTGMRRCLRPAECPFASVGTLPLGDTIVWRRALLELLPGDTDLAHELAAVLGGLVAGQS
jgi:hypothetical protein